MYPHKHTYTDTVQMLTLIWLQQVQKDAVKCKHVTDCNVQLGSRNCKTSIHFSTTSAKVVWPNKITYTAMWQIERVHKSIFPVYLHLMSRALVWCSFSWEQKDGHIIQMRLGHRDPPALAVFAGTLHPWTVWSRGWKNPTHQLWLRRGDHTC